MTDTTRPCTLVPTGYLSATFFHGYSCNCLRPSDIRSRSQSISRILTSRVCPISHTSDGCPIRPHDMSVMWSNPSIPPRSIKAPKSVIFFITPVRRSPTLSSSFSSSRFPARSSSSSTRRLTTMFRRRLFSLRILKSYSSPSRSSTLGTRRSAI